MNKGAKHLASDFATCAGNNMLITDQYRELNAQLHNTNPNYGVSSSHWAPLVMALSNKVGTRDILDYGCGKGLLKNTLVWPIREYDPAIPGKDAPPEPADLVACTDVLEHIEPECLEHVLNDLQRLTREIAFLNIATRPAKKNTRGWPQRAFDSAALALLAATTLEPLYPTDGGKRAGRIYRDRCIKGIEPLGLNPSPGRLAPKAPAASRTGRMSAACPLLKVMHG